MSSTFRRPRQDWSGHRQPETKGGARELAKWLYRHGVDRGKDSASIRKQEEAVEHICMSTVHDGSKRGLTASLLPSAFLTSSASLAASWAFNSAGVSSL